VAMATAPNPNTSLGAFATGSSRGEGVIHHLGAAPMADYAGANPPYAP
jgi:hypothetical protein